ncbi:hypothetical protein BDZ89DRAFT_1132986 [Hymenopellis radicata]|nr:hypothetical protein BDZ89DRAFT_1132986 [Hymenopellis radicata]
MSAVNCSQLLHRLASSMPRQIRPKDHFPNGWVDLHHRDPDDYKALLSLTISSTDTALWHTVSVNIREGEYAPRRYGLSWRPCRLGRRWHRLEAGEGIWKARVARSLIQKGVIVVTTTSKPERIAEILSTPDSVPDLTAEEMAAIDTEGSQLHKRIFGKHILGESAGTE